MGPAGVVETEITADRDAGLGDHVVGPKVDRLIFHRAPEPLDQDVVAPGTLAVHADGNAVFQQHLGAGAAGELAALVGIEDLWPAVASQGCVQSFQVKFDLQRDRQRPRQNSPAKSIPDRGEVDEGACNRNVGNVHCSDLVRPAPT